MHATVRVEEIVTQNKCRKKQSNDSRFIYQYHYYPETKFIQLTSYNMVSGKLLSY
jgi:hypothetical protein